MIEVIHALILLLWYVRQMRMIQSGIMTAVIHTLILPWCVRTSNAYGSKYNNDIHSDDLCIVHWC